MRKNRVCTVPYATRRAKARPAKHGGLTIIEHKRTGERREYDTTPGWEGYSRRRGSGGKG